MISLSLDASTPCSVVALSDGSGLICGAKRLLERGRSDALISLVSHCLEEAGIGMGRVDRLAVGIGPGSFTGLRIALSTVKGLSYALGKPCSAFSSLDAIAFNRAPVRKNRLCVTVDAKRSNVYCRFYARKDSAGAHPTYQRLTKDLLLGLEAFEKKAVLERGGDASMSFCGDAVPLYKEKFSKKREDFQFLPQEFWYPTPESLAFLAQEQAQKGRSVDCFGLLPAYLYEQDCQVKNKCA